LIFDLRICTAEMIGRLKFNLNEFNRVQVSDVTWRGSLDVPIILLLHSLVQCADECTKLGWNKADG
jgi:hypothetical protein